MRSPHSIPHIHSCTTSLSHPPSAATCDPMYLNTNFFLQRFEIQYRMHSTPITIPQHLIILLLPTVTLNFLLSHTQPNSLTSQHNFSSESATSAVSSANNSWFISNLPPFTHCNSSPFPRTLTFTSQTTPSIYTLNNHGDITQPVSIQH